MVTPATRPITWNSPSDKIADSAPFMPLNWAIGSMAGQSTLLPWLTNAIWVAAVAIATATPASRNVSECSARRSRNTDEPAPKNIVAISASESPAIAPSAMLISAAAISASGPR